MRNQRIFLTGATGFVGTWLLCGILWADEAFHLNVRVTVLTRDATRYQHRHCSLANDPRVELLEGEGRSFLFPSGEFAFVIHALTEPQFAATEEFPESMLPADVDATRRVLEFARSHGTTRFLFTSSGAAYGVQPPEREYLSEDYAGAPSTVEPAAVYGHAKRISEWLITTHSRQFGFIAPIARLFAFVGPFLPLDLNFAVGNFIRDVLAGGPVRIGGDGSPMRSYLYAADLAIWLWTILLRGESARLYNVGSSSALSIAELGHKVASNSVVECPVKIAKAAIPGVPPARYVPDVSRAERELGLRVLVPLEEALRRTFQWYAQ